MGWCPRAVLSSLYPYSFGPTSRKAPTAARVKIDQGAFSRTSGHALQVPRPEFHITGTNGGIVAKSVGAEEVGDQQIYGRPEPMCRVQEGLCSNTDGVVRA